MTTCDVKFTGFGGPALDCHRDSGEVVGSNIAATAMRDPQAARIQLETMFTALAHPDNRREVARGLAQGLPLPALMQLAENKDGRVLLERALAELKGDLGDGDNQWAADQIGTALKTVDLKHSDAFKNLDATSQQTILDRLGYPVAYAGAVDNLIALAKSPGFQTASPDTRKALLSALAEHPGDAIFGNGLQKLADDAAFKKLTPAQQASAIGAFKEAAAGEGYQGRSGSVFGIGATSPSDGDKRQVLDNARQVVTSAGFNHVGASSQRAIMEALAEHPTSAAFTGRLLKLINDPGFMALNDASKETKLLDAYSNDKDFAKGVDTLLANGRYTALGGADRAKVLGDVIKLKGTDSYKDANATQQQAMVEIVGDISAQSAAHPTDAALRNTLNQVVDGKIKIGLYERDPLGSNLFNWGQADDKGIYLNVESRTRAAAVTSNKYVETLVHEVNHKINTITTAGTADRFLDEYRAAIVGKEAALNRPLTASEQKRVLDNLVDGTNSDYSHLANLYNHDAKFKAAVDAMYTALNGTTDASGTVTTPPATVSPEDARQRLRSAGNDSDYLKKAGNLDNH
jgi:hypothetical protein